MTNGEQKMLARGVAAGLLIGIAIGLVVALFMIMKPHNWGGYLSVGIGASTAIALSLWAAFSSQARHSDVAKGPKRR